ncbi:hypothetical protein UCRPA7_4037 [Phaeoacremonium minimum UCRPA7]|uniref:Uncharacterized protein n=1 Tax=Phaeoacremonium minimum (strain UCR-PA7) TaxID=1286976 RepID=R8BM84_PHAM7|nr:hypothetical protein UCRPA7_4037 [Phaeoacremonium minimum UCRPA7]EOO00469.1 hypothetical protein UCRPA7_4037 [Phaeoacremonium minimum UCRPA7]
MPTTARPKLTQLTTPVSASYPADALLSASSVRTPLSASIWGPLPSAGLPSAGIKSAGFEYPMAAIKQEEKTPITPPVAYMDFLKSISMASPSLVSPPLTAPLAGKAPLNRTSTAGSMASNASSQSSNSAKSDDAGEAAVATDGDADSAPSTATSEATDCSCSCNHVHKSPKSPTPTKISTAVPASPFNSYPLSAPATGPTSFPSLRIPPSPAVSNVDSPVRSPFSARSVKSPFDWDAALKARRYTEMKPSHGAHGSTRCEKSKTSVRHIREVVTRTVTYTPRMDPAPKGKRRKVE